MKIKDRGYWVSNHFYWQSLAYYFYYSARFRSFTFFTACNPAIDMGGMLDENKSDIYELLSPTMIPTTIKITSPCSLSEVQLAEADLTFPLIVKPNIGFKGYKVAKVENMVALNDFMDKQEEGREWLVQSFIDYKREFSLFYYRIPGSHKRGITSLVEKVFPHIIGDGVSSLSQLLTAYKNPFLDRKEVMRRLETRWQEVPDLGERIVLDEIGNYARGSKFYDLGDRIDDGLLEVTDDLFKEVTGLDFFRMDFKADNLEAYKRGEFKVLEINGMKSEPIHIYDAKHSFIDNTKTIHRHWMTIRDIVKARIKLGEFTFPSTSYGLKSLFAIKRLVNK